MAASSRHWLAPGLAESGSARHAAVGWRHAASLRCSARLRTRAPAAARRGESARRLGRTIAELLPRLLVNDSPKMNRLVTDLRRRAVVVVAREVVARDVADAGMRPSSQRDELGSVLTLRLIELAPQLRQVLLSRGGFLGKFSLHDSADLRQLLG